MDEIERPDKNVLYVWRAEVLITWGILTAVALGIALFATLTLAAPAWFFAMVAVPVCFAILSLFLLRLRWERWTFQITPYTLEMSHGWLIRHRRIVSRNRIQHVDFESGPIGRKFDLVHVVVHTAGATVGTIPGVKSERAERLRTELMSGPKAL
ncbi:MAG TPA: PH domain-containing protein [Fimbriimonas sp.]|nr:PH domain-containing protein [Fimbriimonas sp.]